MEYSKEIQDELYESLRIGLEWITRTMKDFSLESDGTWEQMFDAVLKANPTFRQMVEAIKEGDKP